ncbi:hypothetical protein OQA88_12242 [Cercophora sp. LCS_1]
METTMHGVMDTVSYRAWRAPGCFQSKKPQETLYPDHDHDPDPDHNPDSHCILKMELLRRFVPAPMLYGSGGFNKTMSIIDEVNMLGCNNTMTIEEQLQARYPGAAIQGKSTESTISAVFRLRHAQDAR